MSSKLTSQRFSLLQYRADLMNSTFFAHGRSHCASAVRRSARQYNYFVTIIGVKMFWELLLHMERRFEWHCKWCRTDLDESKPCNCCSRNTLKRIWRMHETIMQLIYKCWPTAYSLFTDFIVSHSYLCDTREWYAIVSYTLATLAFGSFW